ncbi:MFS transporter [Streptomyces sp. NBC_00239]|uniref:MFS transporter n=1 Tax=Streptomyces sp. NBC_00239 TaxID=2903640 RepID=UPI002E2BFAFA|nr:MFS transporter [Streptomyces sp. NBC_00239]
MTSTSPGPTTPIEAAPPVVVGWPSVLRLPHCTRLLGGTLLGRIPLGMAPVVLLLAVREQGGSYTLGAALAGAFGLAVAAGQPLLGRLADRIGQTIPLVAGALLSAIAFTVIAVTGTGNLPAVLTAAVVAGVSAPPLEASLRALWTHVVPSPSYLRAAYSLDSGSQELVYVAGPLLATAVTAVAGSTAALLATGLLGLMGAAAVATSVPSRTWRPTARSGSGVLGALGSAGLRLLLLALIAVGASLGALNVAALAAAERSGATWLSGALPAALSIGALIGSALYASRPWQASPGTQLVTTGAGFTASWLPLCLDMGPYTSLALAVIPGMFFGPLLTSAYQCLDLLARPGMVTESFGWLVSAFGIGTALGTAAAGPGNGSWAVPALAAAVALPLLQVVRRQLDQSRPSRTTS